MSKCKFYLWIEDYENCLKDKNNNSLVKVSMRLFTKYNSQWQKMCLHMLKNIWKSKEKS